MTDRKKLVAALEYYRHGNTELQQHDWEEEFVTVYRAAEAHLASLPKPMWKVRSFGADGAIFFLTEWLTQREAFDAASNSFAKGERKIEIEAP